MTNSIIASKRIRSIGGWLMILILIPQPLPADPVAGTSLNIGPTDSTANTVGIYQGGAIGWGNTLSTSSCSLTVGCSNLWSASIYSFACGEAHQFFGCYASAAFGVENHLSYTYYESVFGYGNTATSGGADFISGAFNEINAGVSISQSTSVFGESNLAQGAYGCFLAGMSNDLRESFSSVALGSGLIVSAFSDSRIALGRYNLGNETGSILVVGNGNWDGQTATRRNALVVYENGDVVIPKAQGDILMGEFGN